MARGLHLSNSTNREKCFTQPKTSSNLTKNGVLFQYKQN